MRLIFTAPDDLAAAVADLRAMTPSARKLLGECIQAQGVTRSRLSAAAIALEDASFIRIRESGWGSGAAFKLLPTLAGEEAMEAMDNAPAG